MLNVCEPAPNSGVLVLPSVIAPAARMRVTIERVARRHVVAVERRPARRPDARRVDEILVGDGQPMEHAERSALRATVSSARAASAIARSATSVTMALTFGFTRSIRARCAVITSRADTCLRRIRAASSTALRKHNSDPPAPPGSAAMQARRRA